jgi:hypothetical protein
MLIIILSNGSSSVVDDDGDCISMSEFSHKSLVYAGVFIILEVVIVVVVVAGVAMVVQ